jgi:hypothetical protein
MWATVPIWWNHVIRVVFVVLPLFVSACTTPGHSSSTPAAIPSEGGRAGTVGSGDGDGGNEM